jgi:hypothetical protein
MRDMSEERSQIPQPDWGSDANDGDTLGAAAALYRQIWGTDPEPAAQTRTHMSTLRPAPPDPTRQDAGTNGDAAGDLPQRLAALERRVEELIPQLEAEEIEALGDHSRAISALQRRLAALENELRDFTHSFNGRMDRVERTLHRFLELSRRVAAPHPPSPHDSDAFER